MSTYLLHISLLNDLVFYNIVIVILVGMKVDFRSKVMSIFCRNTLYKISINLERFNFSHTNLVFSIHASNYISNGYFIAYAAQKVQLDRR